MCYVVDGVRWFNLKGDCVPGELMNVWIPPHRWRMRWRVAMLLMVSYDCYLLNKHPGNGPSSQLIALLHHLQSLLENLPENLPLDLTPLQNWFRLDYETISEEGVWFAFNQNMEVNFKTHPLPSSSNGSIVLREWGECWRILISLKDTEDDDERWRLWVSLQNPAHLLISRHWTLTWMSRGKKWPLPTPNDESRVLRSIPYFYFLSHSYTLFPWPLHFWLILLTLMYTILMTAPLLTHFSHGYSIMTHHSHILPLSQNSIYRISYSL